MCSCTYNVELIPTEKHYILLKSTWDKDDNKNRGLKSLNTTGGKLILFKIIV